LPRSCLATGYAAVNGAANMFLFALAPIFYHELGHLAQGSAGSFLDFIADIAREFASRKILARENAADEFAVKELRRYLKRDRGFESGSLQRRVSCELAPNGFGVERAPARRE
jgi:hypothetical protein